jgi:hypothetical protein
MPYVFIRSLNVVLMTSTGTSWWTAFFFPVQHVLKCGNHSLIHFTQLFRDFVTLLAMYTSLSPKMLQSEKPMAPLKSMILTEFTLNACDSTSWRCSDGLSLLDSFLNHFCISSGYLSFSSFDSSFHF